MSTLIMFRPVLKDMCVSSFTLVVYKLQYLTNLNCHDIETKQINAMNEKNQIHICRKEINTEIYFFV